MRPFFDVTYAAKYIDSKLKDKAVYSEDEQEQSGITPNFIPALLRYKWYIVLTSIPLLIIASLVVISLPPIFRSQGTVMVETQSIPTELVQTTVTSAAKERIEVIRQRVMTREKLLTVIRNYEYFELDENNPIQIGQVIDSVRRSIYLDVIESQTDRRTKVAIAFTVGFDSRSPAIAHSMANDLVTLFLSENVKVRTQRASNTTAFLRAEADKVKKELDQIEASVAEFKQQNKDSLPEHLPLLEDMRLQFKERLENINREIRLSTGQIELIKAQLSLQGEEGGPQGLPGDELGELKAMYRELSLKYRPEHPDLVELRQRIGLLESSHAVAGAVEGEAASLGGGSAVRKRLSSLELEINRLRMDKKETETEITEIEQRILNVPIVERGFIDLKRGYEAKLSQYNSITGKIMDAAMAESLEQSLQAEKFSIIEPPILPQVPVAPDRILLLAAGVCLSFGFPIAIALALGFFDKTIRSRSDFQRLFAAYPQVSLGRLKDENKLALERKKIRAWFVILVLLFLSTMVLIHFLVMPLDQIVEKVLARFGIFIY